VSKPTRHDKTYYVTPTREHESEAEEVQANGGNLTAVDIAFSREYEYVGCTSVARDKHYGSGAVFIRGEGGMFHDFGVFRKKIHALTPTAVTKRNA
jgi:hypothetical protein